MMILHVNIITQKLKKIKKNILIAEPTSCIKFLVLVTCFVIMLIQLHECFVQLTDPPIITHTRLTLNESMQYPALTICREPPFNRKYYKLFNFTNLHLGSYPVTSYWNYFPYETYNISDFWEKAVYNESIIACYGLTGLENHDLELQSSLHLTAGMCHTIRPKREVPAGGKETGYHILLLHDLFKYDPFLDKEAGWYIFIHEVKERFSENINIHSGRQSRIFIPVGEKIEVTLDVFQFKSIQNCSDDVDYNVAECEEDCWIKEDIAPRTNCSGPWFPKLKKPHCNESSGMIDLVKATVSMFATNCCQKRCQMNHYKTAVVKRTRYPPPTKYVSGAWIYFASKAVIMVEEKYSYNWNVFVSDLGGSIGFLLGLSVIGIIGYLERFISYIICFLKRNKKA